MSKMSDYALRVQNQNVPICGVLETSVATEQYGTFPNGEPVYCPCFRVKIRVCNGQPGGAIHTRYFNAQTSGQLMGKIIAEYSNQHYSIVSMTRES